jgi:serine protease Do
MTRIHVVVFGAAALVAGVSLLGGCAGPEPQPNVNHPQSPQRHVNGSQSLAFHRAIIDIPAGKQTGKLYAGTFHQPKLTFTWNGNATVGAASYRQQADAELRESGFTVLGDPSQLFGNDAASQAQFQLGATIKDVTFNAYDKDAGNFTESTVQVEWQLYDSFSKKVVLKESNSGYGWQTGIGPGATPRAFRMALRTLVAESRFAELVATNNADVAAPIYTDALTITTSKLAHGLSLPEDMDKVLNGVVIIRAGRVMGSGVIVSGDGYIVTSAHLVSGAKEAAVVLKNGLELSGSVVRVDEAQDLALVKIPGQGHHALELEVDGQPSIGSEVYAVGAPLGENLSFSVTKGVVSGYREFNKANYLQTDASINSGNSGGPLVDKNGRVVGIVSWKIAGTTVQGLAFAVPIDVMSKRLGIAWRLQP